MSEQGEATASLNSHRSEMEKIVSDVASEVLTKFRLEGTLCDVVIKVGHIEFNAHKIILCRCTSYFRALFTGPWATSKKQIYTIPGVSPEMMHLIINYAYTNSVPVTKDNVVEVLEAADQFLVLGIVQTCCFFLEDQLCLKNCISIWRLLNMYHCPELRHKVFLYILYHFELVCVSQEFLELPLQQLVAIIVNDHLKVKQENIVFEAILRLINHLPDQRRGHMSVLLSKVYICGGFNGHSILCTAECYDPNTNWWTRIRRMMTCRTGLGVTAYKGRIYAVGGSYGETFLRSAEAYNPQTNWWSPVPSMYSPRSHFGIAVVDDQLFVVGGYNGSNSLLTVERFDEEAGMWYRASHIEVSRSGLSCCVLYGLSNVVENLFPRGSPS